MPCFKTVVLIPHNMLLRVHVCFLAMKCYFDPVVFVGNQKISTPIYDVNKSKNRHALKVQSVFSFSFVTFQEKYKWKLYINNSDGCLTLRLGLL